MIQWMINGLIIVGSLLMIVNIIGFIRYAVFIRGKQKWNKGKWLLYVPIILLIFFFLGYVTVGIFGSPDVVMAGILFGGSIFVAIMLHFLNSITKMIMENERLEAQLMASEVSNRAKTAFLANVSHEMRTPLNVILGADELAQKRSDVPEETRKQLEVIEKSGNHLLRLINNILDLQNVGTDTQKADHERFSLRGAMNQVGLMAEAMCEENGLRFQMEMDNSIQDGLMGDEMLLKRVLMNLLDNAVKYTPAPGEVSLTVKRAEGEKKDSLATALEGEGCVLQFTVKDTGIGISEEFLPKVFELFSKEDASYTNKYEGSGIGLALTKQKVTLMHGDVTVSSKQDAGTEFIVAIPFEFAKDEDREEAKEVASLEELPALKDRRILIVEDVDDNAEIVADLLELENAMTERARNGEEALEMVERSESHYYDAILMDLRMPVMDGFEAAKRIRSLPREDAGAIPIIALTANAHEEDKKNAKVAGMNAHLEKPTDSEVLYRTLRSLIGKQ